MKRTDIPMSLCTDQVQGNGEDLAKTLEFVLKHRTRELLEAGLSEADLFELRKIAHAYRFDSVDHKTFQKLQNLLPRLESVKISF